jgi:intracellular multiplication protein IcmL
MSDKKGGGKPPIKPPQGSRDGSLLHQDEAWATRMVRDAWTRERAVFLMRIIVVQSVCLLAALILIVMLSLRPTQFRYFLSNSEGQIKEITSISEPLMRDQDVSAWVTTSILQAFTMDFANYKRQLSDSRNNFTPGGYDAFTKALQESGILNSIITFKYTTSVALTQAPVIINEGIVPGSNKYGWQVQVPILVTYQSTQATTTQSITLDILVVRRPESENPRGIGIAQLLYR